jgi:hypothetical protein
LQAILPLRGKILNIERKDEAALYKNEEIQNLILALGLGVKVAYSFTLLSCYILFGSYQIYYTFRVRILRRKLFGIIR